MIAKHLRAPAYLPPAQHMRAPAYLPPAQHVRAPPDWDSNSYYCTIHELQVVHEIICG